MALYRVEFSANVWKDFCKIPTADADRILGKIHAEFIRGLAFVSDGENGVSEEGAEPPRMNT